MPRCGRSQERSSDQNPSMALTCTSQNPSPSSSQAYSPRAWQTVLCWVDSSGRRNRASVTGSKELVQSLGRGSPAQGLSRPAVEGDRHGCKVLGAVRAEVSALREVLAQQPVGVLVRAALPGAVRVAEVDLKTGVDPQAGVLAHLRPLIPGQRSSQLFG